MRHGVVLWGKVRAYFEKKRGGGFRRLAESVLIVSAFGRKHSIKNFDTAAAIVNCAGIRFTGDDLLDRNFVQGGRFADWLRTIDNDEFDGPCIDFIVQVLYVCHLSVHYLSSPIPCHLFLPCLGV